MIGLFKKVVVIFCTLLLWSCDDSISKSGSIVDFVPEGVSVIFKISDTPNPLAGFNSFKTDLKNNNLLSAFQKTTPYASLLKKATILQHLTPSSSSLLCISTLRDSITAFTFISKATPNIFLTDSIANKTIETLTFNNKTVKRITLDSQIAFTAIKDSVFIASSSQQLLLDILDGKTEKNKNFEKIYSIKNTSDFTTILKGNTIAMSDSTSVNFAAWTGLDVTVLPDGLFATGVALARDTIPQLLSVFEGQIPQQNDIANIIPTSALGALSFTFNDAESFQNKLKTFRKETNKKLTSGIFGSINEIGEIKLSTGNAIVIKSIDPSLTQEALARFVSEKDAFREVTISSFNAPELFIETFSPFIRNTHPVLVFQLDTFFIFTETGDLAQQIITAYKNNDCLNKTSYFETHQAQLSNASSLLLFKMQGIVPTTVSGFFNANTTRRSNEIFNKKHPLAVLQYSYDRDFAHVNFISKEVLEKKQSSGSISEEFSLKLPNTLLGDPQFFSNYKTEEKDIVIQDITNTLYLITSNGKIVWKVKLDGPILGKLNEIDMFRNGKKQIAFTTRNSFYVIDRTGKTVAPFPIKFKDPITQPLSVFDYDNNRKYRFIITQGKEIYMYNTEGKTVKGFNFKKAKSVIVLPPQHIRIGNNDYITIAEENGKLNLLSRVGKSRIEVSKNFKFSKNPIEKEGESFVVITEDKKKETISGNGKVTSKVLSVSGNYSFSVKGNTKVTLDDNLLRINGKLVELPFGVYKQPELFFANKTSYISITETQESKVYVYDTAGSLLSGFPVFGTSSAAIAAFTKKEGLHIVVRGDDKEVLLYKMY